MKTSNHTLRFAFVGYQRPWRPLPGESTPEGNLFVYHALPGHVVAWGRCSEEARRNLQIALDLAMDARGDAVAWYQEARARMSGDALKDLEERLGRLFLDPNSQCEEVRLEHASCSIHVLHAPPERRETPVHIPNEVCA